jgi:hypothetical protein
MTITNHHHSKLDALSPLPAAGKRMPRNVLTLLVLPFVNVALTAVLA